MKTSKTEKIKQHLLSGKSLTVAECMTKFKTHKLSSRVAEFKQDGLNVKCEMLTSKKGERFGNYFIPKKFLVKK